MPSFPFDFGASSVKLNFKTSKNSKKLIIFGLFLHSNWFQSGSFSTAINCG